MGQERRGYQNLALSWGQKEPPEDGVDFALALANCVTLGASFYLSGFSLLSSLLGTIVPALEHQVLPPGSGAEPSHLVG